MTKTILIVDDSASMRTLLRLALEAEGYGVVEAGDGHDAIARLATASFNLIVCDLNMPQMDGLAFVRHIKQSVLHRFTPVVMLTTALLPELKAEARAAGVSAWMNKPFASRTLVDAIGRLCT